MPGNLPIPFVPAVAADPISSLMSEGGALVGGSGALLGSVAFIAGRLLNDVRDDIDPLEWAQVGFQWGGTIGLVWWILRPGGVQ